MEELLHPLPEAAALSTLAIPAALGAARRQVLFILFSFSFLKHF
jgi:hypothetical protein